MEAFKLPGGPLNIGKVPLGTIFFRKVSFYKFGALKCVIIFSLKVFFWLRLWPQVVFAGMGIGAPVVGSLSDIYGRKAVSLRFRFLHNLERFAFFLS